MTALLLIALTTASLPLTDNALPRPWSVSTAPPQPWSVQNAVPMPQTAPTLAIVPPSQTITLSWDNSVTPGCSNRLYYWTEELIGQTIDDWGTKTLVYAYSTNTFEVGITNLCRVNVDSTRRFYMVKAVLNGVESLPSNVVKFPGDTVREVRMKTDTGDEVLKRYTNAPPGAVGLFYWHSWESYEP
jgi:hypothetical protein